MSKQFETYEGVAITIDGDGKFMATVNGEEIVKPTLLAIRKAIKAKPKFEPFDALIMEYGDVLTKVRIVGTITRKLRYHCDEENVRFIAVDSKGNRSELHHTKLLYSNTPEAVAAYKGLMALRKDIDKQIESLEDQYAEARRKILNSPAFSVIEHPKNK